MQFSQIQFEYSAWLIVICIITAALGAILLYPKNSNWGRSVKLFLTSFRFVCLFVLSLLLLGPILNQITNSIEKPTWVIGLDNSSSIKEVIDSAETASLLQQVSLLKEGLEDQKYLVDFRTITNASIISPSEILFNEKTTNINAFLKNQQGEFEGRNLAGVVLLSDGIYNQGLSPTHVKYTFPIHTIGLGDTLERNDLYIQEVNYNKIAYQGNDFPLVAVIGNKGYTGNAKLTLSHRGKVLESKNLVLSKTQPISQIIFEIEASESGLQKYQIRIEKMSDENNIINNTKNAYIDIVDGKERILLIASAPNPDIKAISSSLSTQKNYELITYIPGIHKVKPEGKFDLIIYHGIPNKSPTSKLLMKEYPTDDLPFLMIVGLGSDLNQVSEKLGYLNIQKRSNDNDQVMASVNSGFSYFNLSDELKNTLNQLPPLEVPFSEITMSDVSIPLLYQRLGNVVTENPLLLVNGASDIRSAVVIGEGLWRWRLFEFNQYGHSSAFDELILKLVQYLSTKADKRKFKCVPVNNEISTNQALVFETEVYNELYELVYGQTVDLEIINESGEKSVYNFINSQANKRYKINGLNNGIYQYSASTSINNISQIVRGEFIVKDQQIESLNTTADHFLLEQLAQKNNGAFYDVSNFPSAIQIADKPAKGIIHSSTSFTSLINFEWLFVFLIILLSTEWFVRKYNGAY
jgi:hypothetical protein